MAIWKLIKRRTGEGLAENENPNQGASVIGELTALVEKAVPSEFERIAKRSGVLGAPKTGQGRALAGLAPPSVTGWF